MTSPILFAIALPIVLAILADDFRSGAFVLDESYEDGHIRIDQWLQTLDRPTLVVAHGAIGRCLIAEITGLPRRDVVELVMRQGFYCRLADGRAEWFDATADAA